MSLLEALDGRHGRLHAVTDCNNMCSVYIHTYIHTDAYLLYTCMYVCVYASMYLSIHPSIHSFSSFFYRSHSIHPSTGVTIWGNHSSTQYPDVSFSTVRTDAGSKQVPCALWQPVVCMIHTSRPGERIAQAMLCHS